jgi:ABC-type Fe3+ transport system substrate-binding protein
MAQVAGISVAAEIATDPKDEATLERLAKAEGSLVYYGSAPLDAMKDVAAEFTRRYGISVDILRLVGVAQYQRFLDESEAGKHFADVLDISDYPSMKSLIEAGHIADWQVPSHELIPDSQHIGNFAYGNTSTRIVVTYNTQKVSEEEAKILESGWDAVLQPRFKGRFSVTNMKCGTCYAGLYMFLDPKLNYGPEFLEKVAEQKPAVYSETLTALDRVIVGENDFMFWSWESVAVQKQQEGAPIRWVYPAPTPTLSVGWQGVSAHAPHPNAARLFENWMMSPEGAAAIQAKMGNRSSLTGIVDNRPVAKEAWYHAPTQLYEIDWQRWENDFDKDTALWTRILQAAR